MIKRGVIVIIFLVLLLAVIDSAWIFSYKKTITTEIIGQNKGYTISHEFDNALSMNTSNGPGQINSSLKIMGLDKDVNMSLEISTRRTSINSSCSDYDKDCKVIITQIYNNIRKILSNTTNINDDENFVLFKNTENIIEYQIVCVENSCSQRIISNVTLEQIPNSY